jgi:hypothetical protein
MPCENDRRLFLTDPLKIGRCRRKATRTRKTWRFGGKGEPGIVKFDLHLCKGCAKAWDEAKAEAKADAV